MVNVGWERVGELPSDSGTAAGARPQLRTDAYLTLSECLFFGSCIFNDDLDSILYVPLLIGYSEGSGVISPKLCNFGNLKLRWRLHQSQNMGRRGPAGDARPPCPTRAGSAFLAGAGVLQVLLSFPVTFFVYRTVLGIKLFGFLQCCAVFVLFGIGADDVFILTDALHSESATLPPAQRLPRAFGRAFTAISPPASRPPPPSAPPRRSRSPPSATSPSSRAS